MDHKTIPDRNVSQITEADKIARFYGFKPIIPPTLEKQDFDHVKNLDSSLHPAEKAALLRIYFEEKMAIWPQPNLLYCERPFPGFKKSVGQRKNPFRLESAIITLGSSKSVCECLSIQTGLAILNHFGYKNLEVEINSIGDKDSIGEFYRKLTLFVRKNFNSFPADLKQVAKKDPLVIQKECKEEWQNFQAECPKPIDFLSESSRIHFKEILEFLEIMEIPYQINHRLISDAAIGSETIFAIKESGEELAFGFRFSRLARKMDYKKDVPGTILNISAKLKKKMNKVKTKPIKPQFYLVQFGPEAKLKSFMVLRELFRVGVSVAHSIAKDKLGGQITTAESSDAQYMILIGQKEALENAVVIRNTISRAQEVVSISELVPKIKELI